MGILDWSILLGSLAVVLFQGWWCSRANRTNEDYFVGNRGMAWWAVGLSLFASAFSSLSFVGLPREGAYADYHLYLAILFIPLVVAPVVGWLFVPLYQRLQLTSAYEYLERRFNRSLRLMGSLLFAGYIIGWMGSMLYATGIIVQAVLDLTPDQLTWCLIGLGIFTTIYTVAGGYKAVIWTEVVQALLLAGSVLIVLGLALARVDGGVVEVCRLGLEHNKFQMFNWHLDLTTHGNFYSACAFGVFVYLAANATSQAAVQRYVSMPNVAAARRSLAVNGLATAAVCFLFFFLGTTLFAFYQQHPASNAVSGSVFPPLPKKDQLMIHFVQLELPYPGLVGMLLAGLGAAVMSSISGGLNSLTALVVTDWLPGQGVGVRGSRGLSALFGVATIFAALVAPYLDEHVFAIIMKISGAFFGPLFGVFLLGMFMPRANAEGATAAVLAGLVALALLSTSDVSAWWYGAFTCIPALVVGAVVSLFFPAPAPERLRGLVYWNTPGKDSSGQSAVRDS